MSKTTENYGFTKPEVGEFFSLETWNGNMDKIDKELKKREDAQKESDNSLMNPDFTEAKERKNLTSGEKIHLMLGKISKFFSDMKAIAFSGSYNDLVDKPKIPTVLNNQTTTEEGFALDARQANPNIDGTLAKQVADLNGSLKIKIVQWTPYCPRTDFADKVKFSEAMALRYGSLVICAIRIDLSENTPGEYISIVNLPTKLFTGINQTNMDGKEGKWYLDKNTASVFLRSVFEAGTYWLNFMYLEAE